MFVRSYRIIFSLFPEWAQGGDLEAISKAGMNDQVGLLVNSSRQIIYASSGEDFAEAARKEAMALQQEMSRLPRRLSFPHLLRVN